MTVRIGVVAASRIAETAVIEAVAEVDGVEVGAVAARDAGRAAAAAERWDIPASFGSYADLIASPSVDAVYIGTPAAMHRPWAVAAIEAGKHVLCEKPLASNAADAARIADAAESSDVVVMEAYHWRYHPSVAHIRSVLDSGVLGRVERVEAAFDIPEGAIPRNDIRWNVSLGGGATMDLGCYAIQWARFAAGIDLEVVSAQAECPVPGIDGSLRAELRWPSGATGWIRSSMVGPGDSVVAFLRVVGSGGTMTVRNPLAPQHGDASTTVETGAGVSVEHADNSSTYVHQMMAFRHAIVDGVPFPTTARDGVATMAVIDACYRSAGLEPRPSDGP